MNRISAWLVALALVAAACGGGDDAGDTTTTAGTSSGDTSTTAAATTSAVPVANPDDEFCRFVLEYDEAVDVQPLGFSPQEVEDWITRAVGAIDDAVRLAPDEIKADVELFAEAYRGFVDLLAEYDYNFLAIGEQAQDDPRILALEDPELELAGDRIGAYCGIDELISSAPTTSAAPGGGGGVIPGASLPEGFPDALVPPGGEVIASINAGGATSVSFEVATGGDEVIDYYSDLLGEPMQEANEPSRGALWFTTYEGASVNVVVSEVEAALTQVVVTLG